jgi:hypothetical protein
MCATGWVIDKATGIKKMASKQDIELYFPFVLVSEDNGGFVWEIHDAHADNPAEAIVGPGTKPHPTREAAMAAAIAYTWACLPKAVARAKSELREHKRYVAKSR